MRLIYKYCAERLRVTSYASNISTRVTMTMTSVTVHSTDPLMTAMMDQRLAFLEATTERPKSPLL